MTEGNHTSEQDSSRNHQQEEKAIETSSNAEKRKLDNESSLQTPQPANKSSKISKQKRSTNQLHQVKNRQDDETGNESHVMSESASSKIHKVLAEFGRPPLEWTPIHEPLDAKPEIILAMALDALLKSRPISHDLSRKALSKCIETGYHKIEKLSASSWEDRTRVLRAGGYNRYDESGATNLGALADLVNDRYGGDLNNLLKKANNERGKVRSLIKEIKGIGDLGADLFLNSVQSIWPSLAPFVDARSLKTAEDVGIGTDLAAIYAELEHDPVKMSKLANGLSYVRLDKKEHRIEVEG